MGAICRTARRDRHVCLFGMLNADDFAAIVKVPVGGYTYIYIRLVLSLSDVSSDIGHFVKRIEVQFPETREPRPSVLSVRLDVKFSDSVLVNFPSFAPTTAKLCYVRSFVHAIRYFLSRRKRFRKDIPSDDAPELGGCKKEEKEVRERRRGRRWETNFL